MGHSRPRYNAKGRGAALSSKKKGKGAATSATAQDDFDPNAQIIDDDMAQKRRDLLEASRVEGDDAKSSKLSSKKKKRLDSYINKKLKKDRRVELLKELEDSQTAFDANLNLKSSAFLGSRDSRTAQERLDKKSQLLNRKEEQATAQLKERKAKGYHSDESDSSTSDVPTTIQPAAVNGQAIEPAVPLPLPAAKVQAKTTPSAVGSGLKRSADGQLPVPVAVKRRKIRSAWGRIDREEPTYGMDEDGDMESDFDSSDSAFDSDSASESDLQEKTEENEQHLDQGDEDDTESWHGFGDADLPQQDDQMPEDVGNQPDFETDGLEDSNKDEAGSESEDEASEKDEPPRRAKGSFAAWAQQERDRLEGFEAPTHSDLLGAESTSYTAAKPAKAQPARFEGPLGETMEAPKASLALAADGQAAKAASVVHVDRPEAIQEARLNLPILAEEDNIMHAIRHYPVVVLCGETGSGKTTQVPQFLYEAGFGNSEANPGMIGITQPRRVAALSMAKRVSQELALSPLSSVVAHQIRYDVTTSSATKIKFMTDGVLLREMAADFLLSKYSVLCVDEAHERSVNTDVLLGVLSRVVRLREEMWRKKEGNVKPLRLIIMSATLRLTDFISNTNLFPTPPQVINVTARQYPVTLHFSRKTKSDYLGEAYKKVSKIHARLPPGGILVFLTGQSEIQSLCRKLGKRWGPKAVADRKRARDNMFRKARPSEINEVEEEEESSGVPSGSTRDVEPEELELGESRDLALDVDDGLNADTAEADRDALDTDDEDESSDKEEDDLNEEESDAPLHILPLYSLLPTEKQMRVFGAVPEGARLVVVSTNVAETSLTIPGIKYVVDCGRAKERKHNLATGMQSFEVSWISKASASQRSGRAGRIGPGHCYRLYSSAVYQQYLDDHTTPEILRMPIESMVLQMKSMNIDSVSNFPFPTPPDRDGLLKAEKVLTNLGAIVTSSSAKPQDGQITDLGRAMSLFPLPPRFSKMLVTGQQHACLPYVIIIVCALSVGDPFLREDVIGLGEGGEEEEADSEWKNETVMTSAEIANLKNPDQKAKEIRKIKRRAFYQSQQRHVSLGSGASDVFKILSAVGAYEYEANKIEYCEKNFLRAKAMQEIHQLRSQISQIVQANYPGLDAGFVPRLPLPSDLQLKVLRQLIAASFIDQVAVRKDLLEGGRVKSQSAHGVAYRATGIAEDVYIHPSSSLYNAAPPDCVCFQEVQKTTKPWLKGVTKIASSWLSTLGRPLCSFSKVLETPDKMIKSTGPDATTREVFVTPRFAGFAELELPPIKALQKRVGSRWVFA